MPFLPKQAKNDEKVGFVEKNCHFMQFWEFYLISLTHICLGLKEFFLKKVLIGNCHNFLKNGPMSLKPSLNDWKFPLVSKTGLRIAVKAKLGSLYAF